MSAYEILECLADGDFHSGQTLAERFGVSRTAIWKQVALLEELGLSVERVRGQGYRIRGGLDLLSKTAISDALSPQTRALLGEFGVHRVIDSTNAELRRQGCFDGAAAVCLAESQSAGRGRRGRAWISPFASSVYLSAGWRFQGGADVLEGLSLAVGVMLCETLESLGAKGLALKWPNDVLLDGRKLAGILVELSGDFSGPCEVIVGVGINVAMPDHAATDITQPWADLRGNASDSVSRNKLVADLLNRMLPALAAYETQGFGTWRERWEAFDAYAGRTVIIDNAGQRMAGVAAGVDERGALRLRTASGMQTLHGGEVSLRPQETPRD